MRAAGSAGDGVTAAGVRTRKNVLGRVVVVVEDPDAAENTTEDEGSAGVVEGIVLDGERVVASTTTKTGQALVGEGAPGAADPGISDPDQPRARVCVSVAAPCSLSQACQQRPLLDPTVYSFPSFCSCPRPCLAS